MNDKKSNPRDKFEIRISLYIQHNYRETVPPTKDNTYRRYKQGAYKEQICMKVQIPEDFPDDAISDDGFINTDMFSSIYYC